MITAAKSCRRSLAAMRSPNDDNSEIYPHVSTPCNTSVGQYNNSKALTKQDVFNDFIWFSTNEEMRLSEAV